MKILFLTKDRDFANVGHRLAQSLVRVGINAVMYSGQPPAHDYSDRGIVFGKDINTVKKIAKKSDIIIFMHGKYIDLDMDFSDKKVAVFHGASNYRKQHKKLNEIFNPMVDVTLIQTADLLGLGAKKEHWITGCVDTTSIKPVYKIERSDKLKVVHYPSRPKKKGTDSINKALAGLKSIDFVWNTTLLDWGNHMKRISNSDIYIDQFINKDPLGNKMCTPGMTSFEAAALGRIVIANFCDVSLYEKLYGECAIQVANTPDELRQVVNDLSLLNADELLDLQYKSRKWVEKYHSYEAMGNRLIKIFNEI